MKQEPESPRDKRSDGTISVYFPVSEKWLAEIIREEASAQGMFANELLRKVFCEYFAAHRPKLRDLYEKLKELQGSEWRPIKLDVVKTGD